LIGPVRLIEELMLQPDMQLNPELTEMSIRLR
jgi:hypothetical protein